MLWSWRYSSIAFLGIHKSFTSTSGDGKVFIALRQGNRLFYSFLYGHFKTITPKYNFFSHSIVGISIHLIFSLIIEIFRETT